MCFLSFAGNLQYSNDVGFERAEFFTAPKLFYEYPHSEPVILIIRPGVHVFDGTSIIPWIDPVLNQKISIIWILYGFPGQIPLSCLFAPKKAAAALQAPVTANGTARGIPDWPSQRSIPLPHSKPL